MDEDIQAGVDEFLFILDHDAGAAAAEEIEDFDEVEHIRTDDDGLAMSCRFQDIMAADMGQAAADEDESPSCRRAPVRRWYRE